MRPELPGTEASAGCGTDWGTGGHIYCRLGVHLMRGAPRADEFEWSPALPRAPRPASVSHQRCVYLIDPALATVPGADDRRQSERARVSCVMQVDASGFPRTIAYASKPFSTPRNYSTVEEALAVLWV